MSTSVSSTTSGTSSTSSNRVTGLISGIDTDTVVQQMLAADQAKIDKVNAKIQTDEWKIDAYREITTTVQAFYTTYFDTLSSTSLKDADSFSSYATTYADTTSTDYVTMTGGTGAETGTYSITDLVKATSATLTGSSVSSDVEGTVDTAQLGTSLTSSNNKLSITFNGTTKLISIATGTTADGLQEELNDKIDAAFGAGKITATYDSGTISFTSDSTSGTDTFSINADDSTALSVLGLTSTSNLSNKVDLDANISDMDNYSDSDTDFADSEGNIKFTINGTSFSFNSETSIQDIMDEVNSSSDIDVKMSYDTKTNSFSVQSNNTGLADKLVIADVKGNFMEKLVKEDTANGTDASITFSDGTEIVRSTNSFTYDGITYEIKQDYTAGTDADGIVTDPIKATISTDTTDTYDFIKGFVDAYNGLIETLNAKLDEEKDSDYGPLTDAQKEEMTDDQIETWETKAKTGLLRNDSTISKLISGLRSALYDSVEGAGISLTEIGITTSSTYTDKGKLEIDETKLKKALANNPDQVTKLFTSSSDKSYYDSLDSTTIQSERYKENGIAQRFSDIIQNAIRTTTDSDGNKGALLEKAGITGDSSEYTNLLYKEIDDFNDVVSEMNDRLAEKEDSLYAKFSAMETALSGMNSQSTLITSMLGS